MRKFTYTILLFLILGSCTQEKEKKTATTGKKEVSVPEFSADSAFYFVKKQVEFGPRIPNSQAHRKAGDYFISQFKKYGASVIAQEFTATTFDNQKLSLRNIIASFNSDKVKRILLAAHWDTRPYADKDSEKPSALFDGANDGASGVGVLLEVARSINSQSPEVGVDILLFDGEDWGERDGEHDSHPLPSHLSAWWCLGSQHWSKNKHKSNYTASFGILLDMVGGKSAQFAKEGYSLEYAPSVVEKVWSTASQLGFSHVFIQEKSSFATDDHQFVNEIAKIPMIDILSYDAAGFGDFHHTRKDNMEIISKETLYAVGKTVLTVIYRE